MGECERPQWVAKVNEHFGVGSDTSLHIYKLAVDLLLFKDGVYLTETPDYRELGEFWENLHPDCRWGGRFEDGNHFSVAWKGMA
jgi:hypothetical protein